MNDRFRRGIVAVVGVNESQGTKTGGRQGAADVQEQGAVGGFRLHVGDGKRRLCILRQFDSGNILKGKSNGASPDGMKREGYAAGVAGHDHVCRSRESPAGRSFRQQIRDVQVQDGDRVFFFPGRGVHMAGSDDGNRG